MRNGVVKMSMNKAYSAVLIRLSKFEQHFSNRLDQIENRLCVGAETLSFFDDALRQYRVRFCDEKLRLQAAPYRLLAMFSTDRELRFPHRKILENLLQQFDFKHAQFREVQFSRLVREARISKGGAKDYLSLLVAKNYVRSRNDGYRRFLRINEQMVAAKA